MRTRTVAILGCARDCAAHLPRALANVEHIASLFEDHRFWAFENDSGDGTHRILQQFAARDPRRKLLSARFLTARMPGRTRRLAYVRQRLHAALQASGYRPDVVVVVDLDDAGAGSPVDLHRFLNGARSFAGWDAAFPRLSYDTAAWHPWPPRTDRATGLRALAEAGARAVRVCSAFNGIGVYKGATYARGSYVPPGQALTGRHARPGPCEHVTFHASLGPGTRLAVLSGFAYP
jgi:hypothetical protein